MKCRDCAESPMEYPILGAERVSKGKRRKRRCNDCGDVMDDGY